MFRLAFSTEEGQTWFLELQEGCNRLGRKPDNDIALDNPGVSSYHCEITLEGGRVLVRDLRSTNGTFIAGQRVGGAPMALVIGQTLQLAQLQMVLQDAAAPLTSPGPAAARAPQRETPADQAPGCLNHPEEPAIWTCSHCNEYYCNPCVHHLRRVGGKYLNLCPHCSFPCELMKSARRFKKPSFWKRLGTWLSRTVRLRS